MDTPDKGSNFVHVLLMVLVSHFDSHHLTQIYFGGYPGYFHEDVLKIGQNPTVAKMAIFGVLLSIYLRYTYAVYYVHM